MIFGRSLLERLMLMCQRAGVKRFFIEAGDLRRGRLARLLGSFRDHPESISSARSFKFLSNCRPTRPVSRLGATWCWRPRSCAGCSTIRQRGPARSSASRAPTPRAAAASRSGRWALVEWFGRAGLASIQPSGQLPFALDGRPTDMQEAEVASRASCAAKAPTTDALMARWVDRRLSWRISKRLARTSITPNQVTLANTVVGLTSAWMFASPSYWMRLLRVAAVPVLDYR